jgi:HlyD family secretion protein
MSFRLPICINYKCSLISARTTSHDWRPTSAASSARMLIQIAEISPVANRQKATVEVKVKIINPDHFLRPDMNASVEFVASAEQRKANSAVPMVSVPKSAIRDQGLFVVADGKAFYRKVQFGVASGGAILIAGELQNGEQVVVSPPASLKNGQAVKISRREDQ